MGKYSGIDLGNKRTTVCVIDNRRQVMREVEVKTEALEIAKALKGFKKLQCLVEACPLAEWLCTEVERLGHTITVVCPRKAKVALESRGARKKTDRRDAHGLAELSRSGWYEAVHRKSAQARASRSYLVARRQLVESSTALASSIRGILRAHGIRLAERGDGASFGERVVVAAEKLPAVVRSAIEELLRA
jgi:transposase